VPAGVPVHHRPLAQLWVNVVLNIMEFCKAFNAKTQEMEANMPIPTVITIFEDKSFTFVIKTPPASLLFEESCKTSKRRNRAGS
jgi:large subunit ribosomal protein L11